MKNTNEILNAWHERITTKKGDTGEEIVEKKLRELGYIIYRPDANEGRHLFDRMCWKFVPNDICGGSWKGFIIEIKTKPKRVSYNDTGIDTKKYWDYKDIQNDYPTIPVILLFVDENLKQVYGNSLRNLEGVMHKEEKKTYFDLSVMRTFCELTDAEVKEIKKNSSIDEKYLQ